MATIDPLTRMNPAAQAFHIKLVNEVTRLNDRRLAVAITKKGHPYLTFHDVDVAFPQGNGIHHRREALIEVLVACDKADNLYRLISLYNQGYYSGRQDEAASDDY